MTEPAPRIPTLSPTAEIAGYAGVVPFVACLAGVALFPGYAERELSQRCALAYGAVILAFVGAVHWGLALAGRLAWTPARVAGSILPSVAGAAATLLGGTRGLALLAVSFGVFWLYEHQRLGSELPPDYVAMRRNLTLAVCALLAVTMFLSEPAGLM